MSYNPSRGICAANEGARLHGLTHLPITKQHFLSAAPLEKAGFPSKQHHFLSLGMRVGVTKPAPGNRGWHSKVSTWTE